MQRANADAPIDHARNIEAHSPRMQNTKPLDPGIIVTIAIGYGSTVVSVSSV